jgi:hypothetical protein
MSNEDHPHIKHERMPRAQVLDPHPGGGQDTFSCVDETQDGRHYLVQRHRCSNFVTGHPAQERLNAATAGVSVVCRPLTGRTA